MAIQVQGFGGVIAEVDGTTFRALRVTSRPLDYGVFGYYRFSRAIVIQAAATANGHRLAMRWTDATRFCVMNFLRLMGIQTAAATATIFPRFDVFVARSFTVFHTTNVTALTLTGNNMKKRTSMGTTLMANIGVASAAAGMTGQTATLDADAILEMATQQTITTPNQQVYQKEMALDGVAEHPYVFAANEGVIVRGPSTVFGAAGTMDLIVDAAWAEVAAY